MQVTIENVDQSAARPMGNFRIPGYLVLVQALAMRGWATFVPADLNVPRAGDVVYVEINQESVSNIELLGTDSGAKPEVIALTTRGNFKVQGVVANVHSIAEPKGQRLLSVHAGDAVFALLQSDLGQLHPKEGEWVRFNAIDVSLWDEAI